jgi:septum formation topological specificity factor MinE
MGLNKKQKKQLDLMQKKLARLRSILASEKKQSDDPTEIPRMEQEIVEVEQQIQSLKDS